MTHLEEVRAFWESNPLWTGESAFEPGSIPFFEEHRWSIWRTALPAHLICDSCPPPRPNGQDMRVLDLGCGIGFWVSEFAMRGLGNLFAADLTEQALAITTRRLEAYGLKAELSRQNAEAMTFPERTFDHVNCQGVIHHTPDTEATVAEIARVLKPGGTASISVYYRNPILRLWPYLRRIGWPLAKLGAGLRGRGREGIFLEGNVDEIVRLYDGAENPIGKSYTREQFVAMLGRHFEVQETYLHFFSARAMPFRIPAGLHRWLDRRLGFMIYATVRKPCAV